MPDHMRTAPVATGAVQDQTTARPSVTHDLTDPPRLDVVFAVSWRKPPRGSDRWPRRVTAYRPNLRSAQRLAAEKAAYSIDPPVIHAAHIASWEVTA